MSNIKKIYTCSYCSKTFSKPSALRPHVYTHTGEKPYICHVDGCGRQFSVVSNLRRHFKVHTAPANKSALSTRQHQRKGQHSTIRAPQHRITETSPPPMPRRLLSAIPSSSSPISAPSMINTIVPSTADDIIVATAPPILSVFSSNPDDNGHMSMWMNPCMPDYAYNAQPFVDNSHNLSSEGVPVDTTTSLPSPCSTNTFSFQFYMDTTESSMTALYTTNDSSNSRLVSSHMCSSLF